MKKILIFIYLIVVVLSMNQNKPSDNGLVIINDAYNTLFSSFNDISQLLHYFSQLNDSPNNIILRRKCSNNNKEEDSSPFCSYTSNIRYQLQNKQTDFVSLPVIKWYQLLNTGMLIRLTELIQSKRLVVSILDIQNMLISNNIFTFFVFRNWEQFLSDSIYDNSSSSSSNTTGLEVVVSNYKIFNIHFEKILKKLKIRKSIYYYLLSNNTLNISNNTNLITKQIIYFNVNERTGKIDTNSIVSKNY